jgi:hypothetical protein
VGVKLPSVFRDCARRRFCARSVPGALSGWVRVQPKIAPSVREWPRALLPGGASTSFSDAALSGAPVQAPSATLRSSSLRSTSGCPKTPLLHRRVAYARPASCLVPAGKSGMRCTKPGKPGVPEPDNEKAPEGKNADTVSQNRNLGN